ncbi:MAG: thermonuclease family protein [Spirochaetales bacterium]|nr:thermonuclease family protein [Candidatus Physcosoma equi]
MNRTALFLFPLLLVLLLASCATAKVAEVAAVSAPEETKAAVHTDYADLLKFQKQSETVKCEVSVKGFVDGDTTHFHVPESVIPGGVLKARYLAINTPESTGKIEEWGKAASRYTRSRLEKAVSIIVESDDGNWNVDSTGGRYLVWVWYKTTEDEPYRCLNVELLQEGLAIASSSANNRYGSVCMAAISQAKSEKKNIYSGEKDPDFFYGDAVELTLKELRANVAAYNGIKVAFEGVISRNYNNSVFVEDYDEETSLSYEISVYYGFGLPGAGLDILTIGNRARIVGTVQYYEAGGSYQVSGLQYRQMKPDDPSNLRLISKGNSGRYLELTPEEFFTKTVTVVVDDEVFTMAASEATLGTTVTMEGLDVRGAYTTTKEDSSSNGAFTLFCSRDGFDIDVRTTVLYDENKNLVTSDAYEGKTITVKGVVDYYDGQYQIKVFSKDDISVQD